MTDPQNKMGILRRIWRTLRDGQDPHYTCTEARFERIERDLKEMNGLKPEIKHANPRRSSRK